MWFFRKKLKCKEVYDYFIFQAVNKNVYGFGTTWKFGKSLNGKSICYTTMTTRYKKWDIACEFYFDKATQRFMMEVKFSNLMLGGNNPSARTLQKMINERFPTLSILYRSNETLVTVGRVECKKREQMDKIVSDMVSKWNASGFLSFVDVNFKTTEELKQR